MKVRKERILNTILLYVISGACLLSFAQVEASPKIAGAPSDPRMVKEYVIHENDSVTYTLKLAYDSAGMPLYYFRNVFTPVCFTDVCKPVYIDLYWDLLGNYIRYEVPETEPLTKADHEEFTEEDYEHLHRILDNPESMLKQFTIYELVDTKTYNLSDSVDAVTGATPQTIRNEVIAGAVYTCFTVWHIVHGPVVNEIRKITESHCEEKLLHRFLKSDNHHYQYWAMDKVITTDESVQLTFLQDVLDIIAGKNIFTALHALDRFPVRLLAASDSIQTWLWSVYQRSHYSLQMAILDKLQDIPFSHQLSLLISADLSKANEAQFVKMLRLFSVQQEVPEQAILRIGQYLENSNSIYATEAYATLLKLPVRHPEVRKQLKEFEKHNRINR